MTSKVNTTEVDILLSAAVSYVPKHIYTDQPCVVCSQHASYASLFYNCNWTLYSKRLK
jgi:hypothetical protein